MLNLERYIPKPILTKVYVKFGKVYTIVGSRITLWIYHVDSSSTYLFVLIIIEIQHYGHVTIVFSPKYSLSIETEK